MKVKIFLNKVYKNSANLIDIELFCNYFNITKNKENETILIIDNIEYIDKYNLINSLEFLNNGYKNIIEFYNKNKIYTSNLEYSKKISFKNFIDAINFIKNI